MSPYDYINSIKSVHNQSKATHIACNIEIGNTHHWFGNMNIQITAGSIIGLNLGIAYGLNFPFQINEKLLLVQVGAELSYLNVSKILDTQMLNQAVRLQGKLFNTYYPLTTSLENDDMVFRPFTALRYPIGKFANLRIMAGYQTIILERTRITFSQKISSSSKSTSRRIATFYPDDTSFDFQYNGQKISHIPFDYSGFFVTMSLVWAF